MTTCAICGAVHAAHLLQDDYGRTHDLTWAYIGGANVGHIAHNAILLLEEAAELLERRMKLVCYKDDSPTVHGPDCPYCRHNASVDAWLAKVRGGG